MEWTKGPWTSQEDKLLIQYVTQNGEGRWSSVSKCTGLKRSGKSSRLRWVNYLRPGLKKGRLTPQEEGILIELHALWGNKWSTIARYLPGRTDNEIKNYWRTHFNTRKPSHVKQEKSRKQESETGDGNDGSESSQEMVLESIDDHQFWPTVYQESAASDFVPMDCYLWGGLWNLDDFDDLCSKVGVDRNRNDVANCSHLFQGDEGDYMSKEFLLLE